MSAFLQMGGNGAYVWSAYGITLAILIWNVWSARARMRRNRAAALSAEAESMEPVRRPKVSRVGDQEIDRGEDEEVTS